MIIDELWTQHDATVIPKILDEDVVYRDVAFQMEFRGHAGVKAYLDQVVAKIPDFGMELVDLLEIGERDGINTVVTHWFYSGTFSAGTVEDKKFRHRGYSTIKFRGDKVVENFDYYSSADFLESIGMGGQSVEGYHETYDQTHLIS